MYDVNDLLFVCVSMYEERLCKYQIKKTFKGVLTYIF